MSLLLYVIKFFCNACLIWWAAWTNKRLPRGQMEPEYLRIYRRVFAMEAMLGALSKENVILRRVNRRRVSLETRAAEVFAALITQDDPIFQRNWLTSTLTTIKLWTSRFRNFSFKRRKKGPGGRDATDPKIVDMIVTLKKENGGWGAKRIKQELRRMGVKVSEPTITRILIANGFSPFPKRKMTFEILRAAVRDAVWAMDYFAVRTAKGKLVQVLLVIDLATRELLDLRVYDGWDVDSAWTLRTLNQVIAKTQRSPATLLHDHGGHFSGKHFERQLRVMEIVDSLSVPHMPWTNCFSERAIRSVRSELLNHIPVRDAEDLQKHLDEYRDYSTTARAHQGIGGRTPQEAAEFRPSPPVLPPGQLHELKLVRREFAHGLLHGYTLERKAA